VLNVVLRILIESFQFFQNVWQWIVLGFLAAGLIREFIPERWFINLGVGRGVVSLTKASILGFLAQFLPHSSLPLAISLFDLGASRAYVLTFLVSTPWLCVIETLILISFLGVKLFSIIVSMTMIAAVIGGLVIEYLEGVGLIESGRQPIAKPNNIVEMRSRSGTLGGRIIASLHYSYDFLKMSGKWIALGFLGAGIAKALIPMETIRNLLGYSLYSIPLAMGVATIIEFTVEASVPIVCSIYSMGASPGSVFAMLMVGVVTDVMEMGTVWTMCGKKTAIAAMLTYLAVTIVFGYMLNVIIIVS